VFLRAIDVKALSTATLHGRWTASGTLLLQPLQDAMQQRHHQHY
jgi:hypothetical protein